jgi:adenine specific DNA methylase Mod
MTSIKEFLEDPDYHGCYLMIPDHDDHRYRVTIHTDHGDVTGYGPTIDEARKNAYKELAKMAKNKEIEEIKIKSETIRFNIISLISFFDIDIFDISI